MDAKSARRIREGISEIQVRLPMHEAYAVIAIDGFCCFYSIHWLWTQGFSNGYNLAARPIPNATLAQLVSHVAPSSSTSYPSYLVSQPYPPYVSPPAPRPGAGVVLDPLVRPSPLSPSAQGGGYAPLPVSAFA